MSYNISTLNIWRTFNENCVCPVCEIRKKTDAEISEMYLSEAVMEDAERHKVNKYGFCHTHYDLLFSGKNKLGLALQISTRIKALNNLIVDCKNVKIAQKYAEKLAQNISSCVICNTLEFNMKRYYETIARLYHDDEKFREVNFKSVKGFCINDYVNLVRYSNKAGKFAQRFLTELYQKQTDSTNVLLNDLNEFTMAFDYRNKTPLTKNASTSLRIARVKLYGDITNLPERR